ncbi:MAG: GNAT family N-acetyltransferase [Acidobacteriaceae bacterium]
MVPHHHLRPAAPADIPALAAMRAHEWQTQEYRERRIAGYLAGEINPQQALPGRAAFVAENDGVVLGFVAGHRTRRLGCDAELEFINTVAAHRGQGIAARLLLAQAAWFVEQQSFRVCVNVAPDNIPALAYYRKHGAQPLNQFFLLWPGIRILLPPSP